MSIAATAVWEVRPTVGSDTNGGGFDPSLSGAGTDYSQQDSKNTTGNNISTTDGVAVGTTTFTSATASFTSAIKGNIIYLAGSGITTGWYEVTGYTNSTTITLDRNPGTGTGVTMNIGGAFATLFATSTGTGGASNTWPFVTNNTIWIKNTGALTVTSTLYFNGNSGFAYNLTFSGYNATRGDNGQITWTTASSINLIEGGYNNYFYLTFNNINFTTTAGSPSSCFYSNGIIAFMLMYNCTLNGFSIGIDGSGSNIISFTLQFCEIKNCTNSGVYTSGNILLLDCYIHSNSTAGVYINSTSVYSYSIQLTRTVISANGVGIYINDNQGMQLNLENCIIYENIGDGLFQNNNGSYNSVNYWNNIFYGNGGYGVNYVGVSPSNIPIALVLNNAFGDNTNGARGNFVFGSGTDISLTTNPFTNPSSGDFTLNSTSGGGTACKGAGYPTALP